METEGLQRDLTVLTEVLGRLLNQRSISKDENIYEAGLTSIMVLPFIVEIEDAFRLTLPESEFLDKRTLRELAELIHRLRQSGG